jgi:hypothetical protein
MVFFDHYGVFSSRSTLKLSSLLFPIISTIVGYGSSHNLTTVCRYIRLQIASGRTHG